MGWTIPVRVLPYLQCQCLSRQPLLIGSPGVVRNFGQRAMPGDSAYLIAATSGIRQPGRCRLAQAMRRALGGPCLVAAIPEPIAKPADVNGAPRSVVRKVRCSGHRCQRLGQMG